MTSFYEYLVARELQEPNEIDLFNADEHGKPTADPIFDDEEMLERAAGVWNDQETVIRKMLLRRIRALRSYLEYSAQPQEVPIVREKMMELATLVDDFQKASQEMQRRRQRREEQNANEEDATAAEGTNQDNEGEQSTL